MSGFLSVSSLSMRPSPPRSIRSLTSTRVLGMQTGQDPDGCTGSLWIDPTRSLVPARLD